MPLYHIELAITEELNLLTLTKIFVGSLELEQYTGGDKQKQQTAAFF